MTREEEKKKAALEYRNKTKEYGDTDVTLTDRQNAFEAGWDSAEKRSKFPWRELQKELPPVKQRVFFLDTNGIPHIGHLEIGKQIIVSADTPKDNIVLTHWMPIPEIPKGE